MNASRGASRRLHFQIALISRMSSFVTKTTKSWPPPRSTNAFGKYSCAIGVEAIPWGPATKQAATEKHIKLPRYKFIVIVTHAPRVYVFDCLALTIFEKGLPPRFKDMMDKSPNKARHAIFGPCLTEDTTLPLSYPVIRFDTLVTYIFRGAQEGDRKPTTYDLGGYSEWKWGYNFCPGKVHQARYVDSEGKVYKHPDTYGHVEMRGSKERQQSSLIETEELLEFKLNWRSVGYINGYLNNVGVTMMAALFEAMLLVNHDQGYYKAMQTVCQHTADRSPELLLQRFSGQFAVPEGFKPEDYIMSSSSARTSASRTPSASRGATPAPEVEFRVMRRKEQVLDKDGNITEKYVETPIPKTSYSEAAKTPPHSSTTEGERVVLSSEQFPAVGARGPPSKSPSRTNLESLGRIPKKMTRVTVETIAEEAEEGEIVEETPAPETQNVEEQGNPTLGEGDVAMGSPERQTDQADQPSSTENMIVDEEAVAARLEECLLSPNQKTPHGQNLAAEKINPGTQPETPQVDPIPTPPAFITLTESPFQNPSTVIVETREDERLEYHYSGLVEGTGEYYLTQELRHATMTEEEFQTNMRKGLDLFFRSKTTPALRARMESAMETSHARRGS